MCVSCLQDGRISVKVQANMKPHKSNTLITSILFDFTPNLSELFSAFHTSVPILFLSPPPSHPPTLPSAQKRFWIKSNSSFCFQGSNSTYTLKMSLYNDSAYASLVSKFPYSVKLKIPLYFKVEFVTNDPSLSMLIDTCKATADSSPSSTPNYRFLKDG